MISMGTVWDRATEFLSDNLAAVVPIALLAIFLPMSVQSSLAPLTVDPGPVKIAVSLLSVVLSVVSLWGQLAIIALAVDPGAGRTAATAVASRRLLPTIGIALLLLAAIMLLFVPIGVALALGGYDFQAAMSGGEADAPAGGAMGFVVLYSIALGIAFCWIAARLALVNPVIVAERRGLGAIARSVRLTRGIAWKIIGVVLLFAIVAIVAVLAVKTVFGSILQIIAGSDDPVSVATVLTSVLVGLTTTGFTVLGAAFTAKLYLAARDGHMAPVEIARPA